MNIRFDELELSLSNVSLAERLDLIDDIFTVGIILFFYINKKKYFNLYIYFFFRKNKKLT